jgi:cytochrome oxidase Cu insertion factor (SCO1/SenC/PrrC family)
VRQAAIALLASALVAAADTRVPPRDDLPSFRPEYVPPAAGSYRLPVIQRVGNHPLLDGSAQPTTLFDLKGNRLAVVAFIYTACTDAGGCPLSQATLLSLDRALGKDPELSRQAMLITVSFDPERDTPERLSRTRDLYAPRSDWRFVTSPGESLQGTLDDFGQPVAKLRLEDGSWSGLYRHVLKVFLLDRENGVRNIYSTGFLDRDLVLNDLRTLAAGG